jgi:putative YphP/YqiW family bacilliredoxin
MYPTELVAPMKEELTSVGYKQLVSSADVDQQMKTAGTTLVMVNSVCGCAAGNARPAAIMATKNEKKPDHFTTVFAGVDAEAVQQARNYMLPYPPSSPSIALFKDGKLVHFIERHHIEGSSAEIIAENLAGAFNEFC